MRAIMALLRSEQGCPWDREQDHRSIRKNFIEETYEAVEAIDKGDMTLLREELGDVLLQVVFHTQMEEETGVFTFDDVVTDLCQKLIIRHPHVFGEVEVKDSGEVLNNWETIKNQVKGTENFTETLKSVPAVFPALMRSEKIAHRAAKAGMRYPDVEGAFEDLENEVGELWESIEKGDRAHMEEELGDLLFSCTNVAEKLGLDAEQALSRSCDKFIARFEEVEQLAEKEGIRMETAELDTLNRLWKKAKEQLI
ncbi:nucleoside triphosphate pyrophosphohydrolase [Fumia xinanensis]|uniref:nucleoside triphosphate pyrophosphohydrolase n=1 Tax=Fumia xinanensis TaxID=2763659 RepID=UPI003211BD94